MTNITWAIQQNLLDINQIHAITAAVVESGASYHYVDVIPFSESIELIDSIDPTSIVIPYGSTALIKRAAHLGWKGLCFTPDTFRVDMWNANRNDMLNQDIIITTVENARTDLSHYSDDQELFIRPMEDLKAFNGTMTVKKEIINWMDSVESGSFNFNPTTEIIVSSAKNIQAEWRYFVIDGKVVDGSTYRIRGQRLTKHENDPDVLLEAQVMADKWLPHRSCVMDLALCDNVVKVIEFNNINSTGFYYNDIPKIVKAMNEYIIKVDALHQRAYSNYHRATNILNVNTSKLAYEQP